MRDHEEIEAFVARRTAEGKEARNRAGNLSSPLRADHRAAPTSQSRNQSRGCASNETRPPEDLSCSNLEVGSGEVGCQLFLHPIG